MLSQTLLEPARETPVVDEFDLCVIGGSCTGVFAAVRAARLGLTVALVEQNIILGGMATAAQVNEWHSLYDVAGERQIIGGLTMELLENLRKRNAVQDRERNDIGRCSQFNSAEMALELDAWVYNHSNIRLFLKASCVAAVRTDNRLEAAIIEDKSGRRAIRARFFIDASGDGDLLRRAGFTAWKNEQLQAINYQMMVAGINKIEADTQTPIWPQISKLADKYSYPKENATPWINHYVGTGDIRNIYGPRLNGIDASDADQLTAALLESRRYHRALHDMMREKFEANISPLGPAHSLGVRETWHVASLHRMRTDALLMGHRFEDSIACGTYPTDVHSADGTVLRFLDGRQKIIYKDGRAEFVRWRDSNLESPSCYYIPYHSLVPESAKNLLVAGRLLDAEREAFGGVRVMVNMNQTGEAAGVASYLALKSDCCASSVDARKLQTILREGGSLLPEP